MAAHGDRAVCDDLARARQGERRGRWVCRGERYRTRRRIRAVQFVRVAVRALPRLRAPVPDTPHRISEGALLHADDRAHFGEAGLRMGIGGRLRTPERVFTASAPAAVAATVEDRDSTLQEL